MARRPGAGQDCLTGGHMPARSPGAGYSHWTHAQSARWPAVGRR